MSDKDFINSPDNWPHWPMLPLKRSIYQNNDEDDAIMFAAETTVLYFANIWTIPALAQEIQKETGKRPTYGDIQAKLPKKEFASLDELLAEYEID